MTKIARYIDDPPEFLLWSIDEIVLFALFFGMGILTHTLIPLLIIGIGVTYLLGKVKQNKPEGYFIHAAYWNFGLPLRGCIKSYLRYFLE